jgi:hypothetical protein
VRCGHRRTAWEAPRSHQGHKEHKDSSEPFLRAGRRIDGAAAAWLARKHFSARRIGRAHGDQGGFSTAGRLRDHRDLVFSPHQNNATGVSPSVPTMPARPRPLAGVKERIFNADYAARSLAASEPLVRRPVLNPDSLSFARTSRPGRGGRREPVLRRRPTLNDPAGGPRLAAGSWLTPRPARIRTAGPAAAGPVRDVAIAFTAGVRAGRSATAPRLAPPRPPSPRSRATTDR